MSRTNIDLDDEAVTWIMSHYGLDTKRDAVNFALHQLYRRPATVEEILALQGTGWGNGLELSDLRPGYVPIED